MRGFYKPHMTASGFIGYINETVLDEREREMLVDKYINGYTFEKIAENQSCSVTTAKRIVYKYKKEIENHFSGK